MTESPEDRLEEIHLYERVAEEIEQGTQVKGHLRLKSTS